MEALLPNISTFGNTVWLKKWSLLKNGNQYCCCLNISCLNISTLGENAERQEREKVENRMIKLCAHDTSRTLVSAGKMQSWQSLCCMDFQIEEQNLCKSCIN